MKSWNIERLLLPFGRRNAVEHIVGSYKTISVEGDFKIDNLMGRQMAAPTRLLSAVIDRDVQPRPLACARPTTSSRSTSSTRAENVF